jgi:hypothetical protein
VPGCKSQVNQPSSITAASAGLPQGSEWRSRRPPGAYPLFNQPGAPRGCAVSPGAVSAAPDQRHQRALYREHQFAISPARPGDQLSHSQLDTLRHGSVSYHGD